jgi:ATP-dependent protease Clp ATPase subunit
MIENILMETMFDKFQENKVIKCIVDADTVVKNNQPKYVYKDGTKEIA